MYPLVLPEVPITSKTPKMVVTMRHAPVVKRIEHVVGCYLTKIGVYF